MQISVKPYSSLYYYLDLFISEGVFVIIMQRLESSVSVCRALHFLFSLNEPFNGKHTLSHRRRIRVCENGRDSFKNSVVFGLQVLLN